MDRLLGARWMLKLALCMALAGCYQPGAGTTDEEKEPYFQAGRARVNALDYKGAIAAFERALEANPRSAAAHFELGWLYADKVPDPAAAIFHYERYLKLRPNAENADTVRQHILRLKQELAKAVLPLPASPGVQRELEHLADENRRLREELGRWREWYAQQSARTAPTPARPAPESAPPTQSSPAPITSSPAAPAPASPTRPEPAPARPSLPAPESRPAMRLHKVQPGETPASIARRYGVSVEALLAANPGLNPRRMQIGQTLNVPGR
ncbi:MAG: LysM peptidoglycan-binding domain-containing protein [Verrucomicrobiae bacterium]|nr:LysM peptidoglycan-binding domain-containing protein [Verrucomicrobiae bacterium]